MIGCQTFQVVIIIIIMTMLFGRVRPLLPTRSTFRNPGSTTSLKMNGEAQDRVHELLKGVLDRSRSTLSTVPMDAGAGGNPNDVASSDQRIKATVEEILDATVQRADSTLRTVARSRSNETKDSESSSGTSPPKEGPNFLYRGNPAITNTALAHSLWSSILRPHSDTAIDATCGNGHDSVALARMLFPPESQGDKDQRSRLICIDVQEQACKATKLALSKEYASLLESKHIQVLQTSHAPLPVEWAVEQDDLSSVGLVVYNLGWLPSNTDGTKEYTTQVDATLQSIVDAMLLLRVGGMLSVVTYPKTNWDEDLAVRTFLECAALLSSNLQTWQQFLEENGGLLRPETATQLRSSMERLVGDGGSAQTWRVSEHKKLGMDRAPILLTAMRIK